MTLKEAIERIKARFDKWALDDKDLDAIQTIIPELAESEDERIRNELIDFVNHYRHNTELTTKQAEWCKKAIAYLERQKEQKSLSTEETELNSIAFLELLGYTCVPPEAEQKSTECDKETDIQKAFREGQNAGRQEVFDNPGAYGLEKIDNVFGFRIGDNVRLVDGDGRPHIIKHFEKIEGLHIPDFYRVRFEDNTASDHIIPGDEYPNGYFTRMEKIDEQQEQKFAEYEKPLLSKFEEAVYDCAWGKVTCNSEGETQEEYAKRWAEHLLLMVRDWADDYIDYQIESAKRKAYDRGKADAEKPAECLKPERDCWYVCIKDFYAGGKKQSSKGDLVQAKGGMYMMGRENISEWFRKAYYDEIKPTEWSEEDEHCIELLDTIIDSSSLIPKNRIKCHTFLKSLRPQPKQEWSEKDEKMIKVLNSIIRYIVKVVDKDVLERFGTNYEEIFSWFKFLRPQLQVDLEAITKREYARGKQDGYWEGVKAEQESCKTFHYESPNWPPKMPDLPTETTTNEGISSIQPHWKPSEEQMAALFNASAAVYSEKEQKALESLYSDLSKSYKL